MTEAKKQSETPKKKSFWWWAGVILIWPISSTIWIQKNKKLSQDYKIGLTIGVWVLFMFGMAFFWSGRQNLNQKQMITQNQPSTSVPASNQPAENTPEPTPTPTPPVEEKRDENQAINEQLKAEREDFDETKGNNLIAAKTAQAFVDLVKMIDPNDTKFDVYLKLEAPKKDEEKYRLGGDQSEYKDSVSFGFLSIVVDNAMWSTSTADGKKDLITSWALIMQRDFPKSSGNITISNGIRQVATADWYSGGKIPPKVELK